MVVARALLIANPAARGGRGRLLATLACNELARQGVTCTLALTERPGHAAELAAGSGGYDAVFALGGDGTAMEVAGALAHTDRPVGVLPGGTGNLLARALGVPLNMRRAVTELLGGDSLYIDLGRVEGGGAFAIAAGVGIDAAMVAATPRHLKRRLGVLAYVIMGTRAAVRAVRRDQLMHAKVTVDGETQEFEAVAIMIANFGALLNETITLGEGITADDGVLDVCIFTPRSVLDALRIARRLLVRDFSPTSSMTYRRGRSIRIETDPVKPAQADGELIGDTPFSVTVDPRCLRLMVPRRK